MKKKTIIIITTLMLCIMLSAANGFADVPAPPVNQSIGMTDVSIGSLNEAECRVCHSSGVDDRHHMLYNSVIPDPSLVPYPDTNGDGSDDTNYSCLSCHDDEFTVERDCTVCHNTMSPHHETASAIAGDCTACHGDIVDNMDDGHYIPTYAPSLVTPQREDGEGEPDNSRGKGAGACDYCHDNDGLTEPIILTNMELHHETGFIDNPNTCAWCHDFSVPIKEQTRVCEGCHGPDSLHNIQADSPNIFNLGTIVVGEEAYGYGHVGRDAGPGDSDCWGCHGFAMASASAPGSGPITPYLRDAKKNLKLARKDQRITLRGSSLTNTFGTTEFKSTFRLTSEDGTSNDITPVRLNAFSSTIIIPGTTGPGNYMLTAVKDNGAVISNPLSISIKPQVSIASSTIDASCGDCSGELIITGSGFGDAPPDGADEWLNVMQGSVKLTIVSWTDTRIEATGAMCEEGAVITVNSLFDSATK
jgi:hypothetical protein